MEEKTLGVDGLAKSLSGACQNLGWAELGRENLKSSKFQVGMGFWLGLGLGFGGQRRVSTHFLFFEQCGCEKMCWLVTNLIFSLFSLGLGQVGGRVQTEYLLDGPLSSFRMAFMGGI